MSHEPGGGERITEELGIIQGPCRTAGPFDSRPGITFPFALSVADWRTVVRDSHVAEGLADGWGRGLAPQRPTLGLRRTTLDAPFCCAQAERATEKGTR